MEVVPQDTIDAVNEMDESHTLRAVIRKKCLYCEKLYLAYGFVQQEFGYYEYVRCVECGFKETKMFW